MERLLLYRKPFEQADGVGDRRKRRDLILQAFCVSSIGGLAEHARDRRAHGFWRCLYRIEHSRDSKLGTTCRVLRLIGPHRDQYRR